MPTAPLFVLLSQDGAIPEWVHLVPAGTSRGVDGRGPFILKDAAQVLQASMAQGKLPIDENHATDFAMKTGQPSPARGWIVAMEARDDGIWGRVEWTEPGKALMSEGAYRGISPVLEHRKDGTVLRVLRAALTNVPNLQQLHTLNSQQETGMDLVQIRRVLSLPETADEAAILAAITANASAVSAHAAQIAAIATAAGLPAQNATADGLVVSLQAVRAGASEAERLAATIVSLQTQLDTLSAATARDKAATFVDGAIRAGKPIAALRDRYVTRHMADPAGVEEEINALPSIHARGATVSTHAQAPSGDEPTESEKAVAARMGVDPKKLAAQRVAREKAGSAA